MSTFQCIDGFMFCEEMNVGELLRQCEEKYKGQQTPLFLYSKKKLHQNARDYLDVLEGCECPYQLNFAIKANPNLSILKEFQSLGISATLVSGNELKLALETGFEPTKLMLNGGGKYYWETRLAVEHDVLINVDSEWDLRQTVDIAKNDFPKPRRARVMLRLNLNIDSQVHKYINTGIADSKFGLTADAAEACLQILQQENCPVELVGLHSHMGSTIYRTDVFKLSVEKLLEVRENLIQRGFNSVNIINVGGGLGIDYLEKEPETRPWRKETDNNQNDLLALRQFLMNQSGNVCDNKNDMKVKQTSKMSVNDFIIAHENEVKEKSTCTMDVNEAMKLMAQAILSYKDERISFSEVKEVVIKILSQYPELRSDVEKICPCLTYTRPDYVTPKDLIQSVSSLLKNKGITLMLEPGRSLVANSCVLVARVLGCKQATSKRFAVVDASMNEVIRPSLYGAYHHVTVVNMTPEVKKLEQAGKAVYDVVGPVCECTDFLAKDRLLPDPSNRLLVVHDVGAYCHSMSSNYNIRMKAAEVMIDGSTWRLIRRQDTLEDILAPYKNLD